MIIDIDYMMRFIRHQDSDNMDLLLWRYNMYIQGGGDASVLYTPLQSPLGGNK